MDNLKKSDSTLKEYNKMFDKTFKPKINKIMENIQNQELFNSTISELIRKLDIEDLSEHDEIENKKDNNNKEVDNKDDSDQKKESKSDENQEMSIETNILDLDNTADEMIKIRMKWK